VRVIPVAVPPDLLPRGRELQLVGAMGGPATTNLPVDTIVWAKVPGFPWWPARVAETPRNHVKKGVKHTWYVQRVRSDRKGCLDAF